MGREGRVRIDLRRQELLMLANVEQEIAEVRAGRKKLELGDHTHRIEAQSPGSLPPPVTADRHVELSFGFSDAVNQGSAGRQTSAARAEVNVSKAVIYAENRLADDPQAAPESVVDEDWLFAWKEYAGRVSTDDLQQLWGSVLAGEVKSPGKYSLRTLEYLKALSKVDAELITKIAHVMVQSEVVKQEPELTQRGLTMNVWLHAQEIGIVSGVESMGLQNTYDSVVPDRFVRPLISNRKALLVEHADRSKKLVLNIYKLTEVAIQIMSLGAFEADDEYLRAIGKGLVGQGFSVKLGDWKQISETEGRYENAVPLTL
jgi:hypothetical protein